MTNVNDKVERAVARFERVTRQLDERKGPVRDAARRERQRLNADLGRRFARVAVAVGLISLVTIIIGLIMPIGMFGFLAAVGLAVGAAGLLGFMPARGGGALPAPSADLPNGEMVQQFDSYLFRARRALPAPAQAEIDALSAALPALRETIARVETLDPSAQDARRLMSIHLPGLIDRYQKVPPAYRGEIDGEGKTVDQRLVEGLAASRAALGEISQRLAKADMAAFETQGRFITSRYGESAIDR
ncbi:hypothetical protein H9L13_06040 [Sphingomonas lutea]|uniref:Uncharacterized protein n=1 Tax=Sphingomonas lutea TaxID=1045317 RepID=A0A7G9SKN9_9SPHN|nr:hypothetical protein [Sphingomonas lutea]QNN68414.1 hypothetical protein H9L13_06040 [Sphingomonas lutea]